MRTHDGLPDHRTTADGLTATETGQGQTLHQSCPLTLRNAANPVTSASTLCHTVPHPHFAPTICPPPPTPPPPYRRGEISEGRISQGKFRC